MAVQPWRINVNDSEWPLRLTQAGQSVMVRQRVGEPSNAFQSPTTSFLDAGNIIFCENILPAAYGMKSVGYKRIASALPGVEFDEAIKLRTSSEQWRVLSPAGGMRAVYNEYSKKWVPAETKLPFAGWVSRAYIKQRTFVCYQRAGVQEENQPVTLTGVNAEMFDGITYAVGSMVAWSGNTIYWSSFLDPTDFVPSLSTGAGSEQILSVRGTIVACLPLVDGFAIYTTENVVAALFSGDIQKPWVFREVDGSQGISSPYHVTFEANFAYHVAYTKTGFMRISRESARLDFPAAFDYLRERRFEEFVGETGNHGLVNRISVAASSEFDISPEWPLGDSVVKCFQVSDVRVKLAFIGSRYLCISYGWRNKSLNYVLVYDDGLKRWGKLKVDHVDCFEGNNGEILFLERDGGILSLDLTQGIGVAIYGALQHIRGRQVRLDYIETENARRNRNLDVKVIRAFSGGEYMPAEELDGPVFQGNHLTRWTSRAECRALYLQLTGDFELTGLYGGMEIRGQR